VHFFHLTDFSNLLFEGLEKSVKEEKGQYIMREERKEWKGQKGEEGLNNQGGKAKE
jgi:hypothetical protein